MRYPSTTTQTAFEPHERRSVAKGKFKRRCPGNSCVTNSERDHLRIPGLKIENWAKP
ncbi:MAG: hypothetical protein ACREV4_10780 [Gammaproteobacteria bacterium]